MSYNYYKDEKLSVVTDTHFGRTFKEGIPLDRRGEYEQKIYSDFEKFLTEDDSRIVIHAGDLFESPYVSNEVLMRVCKILETYTAPLTHYYFIAGNHDLPKDDCMTECSSFYILSKLLEGYSNIHFLMSPRVVEDDVLLVPYSHFSDVNDDLSRMINSKVNYVIGHFDDPVPQDLSYFSGKKLSGHFHKKHLTQDGTLFIGSFYPIAFGEESDNSVMETMTLEEYNKRTDDELKDKRIRLLLKEGEELPTEHNCLQLIGKKEKTEEINLEVEETESFDFYDLFLDCLKDSNIKEELLNRYYKLKGND